MSNPFRTSSKSMWNDRRAASSARVESHCFSCSQYSSREITSPRSRDSSILIPKFSTSRSFIARCCSRLCKSGSRDCTSPKTSSLPPKVTFERAANWQPRRPILITSILCINSLENQTDGFTYHLALTVAVERPRLACGPLVQYTPPFGEHK